MDNSALRNGVSAIVEYDYAAKEPDELSLTRGAVLHNIKVQKGGWWEGTLAASGRTGMFPDNFVKVLEPDAKNPVVLRDKSATASRRCKAVYSYTQNNQDELTLAVGDVIEFLDEVEEGWWRGRLANKTGVFPSNFVVMETQSPALAANRRSSVPPVTTATAVATSTTSTNANSSVHTSSTSAQHTSSSSSTSHSSSAIVTATSITTASNATNASAAANAAAVAYAAAAVAKQMSSSREDLVSDAAAAPDAPILPPKPVRELCKVLFPYLPANDDELELREGEVITILSRELPDKGWLKGELRGKIGVFPDNFVELISPEVSPVKESAATVAKPERPPASTKMLNKNTSLYSSANSLSSSTASAATTTTTTSHSPGGTSGHKDSFGSRDSLNESAAAVIPTGNVAAYRKSLEKQALDITGGLQAAAAAAASAASATPHGIEKPARKLFEAKPAVTMTATTTTTTTTATTTIGDFRKSMESLDEKSAATKAGSVPPVLTKKPLVPIKKSPTVSSVANSIFSGLKSKVGGGSSVSSSNSSSTSKSAEATKSTTHTTTTTATVDNLDGGASSRMYHLADHGAVTGERIRQRDNAADFDQVERGQSILQDMRAGRAKAPKRRPPTSAINSQHSSSESSSAGDSGTAYHQNGGPDGGTNGDSNAGEFEPRQPSQRNWEKQKAPWMDELRASQAKKISPNAMEFAAAKSLDHDAVERSHQTASSSISTSFDMSKSFSSTSFLASSHQVSGIAVRKSSASEYNHLDEETSTTASTTNNNINNNSSAASVMARSMSALSTSKLTFGGSSSTNSSSNNNSGSILSSTVAAANTTANTAVSVHTSETVANVVSTTTSNSSSTNTSSTIIENVAGKKPRPTSVNLRNRSISPIGRMSTVHIGSPPITGSSIAASNTTITTTNTNNHHHELPPSGGTPSVPVVTTENVCPRVAELELKVVRLERIIQQQQATIEEVLRTARDESDRVRALRAELDKYAQFVTQV